MTPLKARTIARIAHKGQRFNGEDYLGAHTARVAAAVQVDARCTDLHLVLAYLCNVVEDGGVTWAQLATEGMTLEEHLALQALTRYEGESYRAYIERLLTNRDACLVKYHELVENLDADPPTYLLDRYHEAVARIILTLQREYQHDHENRGP